MIRSLVFFLSAIAAFAQTQVVIGSWRATGPLNEARYNACAVRLPDATVLVVGGTGVGGRLASTEIYQPEGVFAGGPPMNTARAKQTCTLLANGKVLVAGGDADGTGSAEVYDPPSKVWTPIDGPGIRMEGHTATLLNNGLVLLVSVNGMALFDPSVNTLIPLAASLRSTRNDFATVLMQDGRVLITGGQQSGFSLKSTEIFDPLDFSVTEGPSLNLPRTQHSATTLDDGRVLVVGGHTDFRDTNTAEVLDPATGAWSILPSTMRDPRRGHFAIAIPGSGSVLIAGGLTDDRNLASTELFQLETDSFLALGDLTLARSSISGAVLNGGVILAMGGLTADGAQAAGGVLGTPVLNFTQAVFVHPATITATGAGFPGSQSSVVPVLSQGSPRATDASSRLLQGSIPLTLSSGNGTVGFASTPIVATQSTDVGKQFKLIARSVPGGLSAVVTTVVKAGIGITVNAPPSVFVNQDAAFTIVLTPTTDAGPLTGTLQISGSDTPVTAFSSVAIAAGSSGSVNRVLTLNFSSPGRRVLTVSYSGDPNYAPASVNTPYTVFSRAVTATFSTSPTAAPVGAEFTLTAFVFSTAACGGTTSVCDPVSNTIVTGSSANIPFPSGPVTFLLNGGTFGQGTLAPSSTPGVSTASVTFTPTSTVPLQFSAQYPGDGFYLAGASTSVVTPSPGPTSLSFVAPPKTYACGGDNTLTTRLTFPATAGLTARTLSLGTLNAGTFVPLLTSAENGFGPVPVNAPLVTDAGTPGVATATFADSLRFANLTQLTARFTGDPNLKAVDSTIPVAMQKLTPAVQLSANQTAPAANPVVLTATVGGSSPCPVPLPTGTMQFFDTNLLLGIQPLANGTARLQTSRPSGSRSLSVIYSGDTNWESKTGTLTLIFK